MVALDNDQYADLITKINDKAVEKSDIKAIKKLFAAIGIRTKNRQSQQQQFISDIASEIVPSAMQELENKLREYKETHLADDTKMLREAMLEALDTKSRSIFKGAIPLMMANRDAVKPIKEVDSIEQDRRWSKVSVTDPATPDQHRINPDIYNAEQLVLQISTKYSENKTLPAKIVDGLKSLWNSLSSYNIKFHEEISQNSPEEANIISDQRSYESHEAASALQKQLKEFLMQKNAVQPDELSDELSFDAAKYRRVHYGYPKKEGKETSVFYTKLKAQELTPQDHIISETITYSIGDSIFYTQSAIIEEEKGQEKAPQKRTISEIFRKSAQRNEGSAKWGAAVQDKRVKAKGYGGEIVRQ